MRPPRFRLAVPVGEDRRVLDRAITAGFLGPDPLGAEEPPTPVGYRLLSRLGQGGAGTVYLAQQTALERPVALKFLNDARRLDVERFRREARFAARLRDPAIVQVYEFGDVDGQPFIAMQYVDGGNLAQAELDHATLLAAVRGVVLALEHAHAQGIVHRDIKPENILLDRLGHAYLTDFGIARDLGADLQTLSRDGQIMGTPSLMPPEQARGASHEVDARSDVYAVGATLYHKLTGRAPFVGASVIDVLHAVIHDEPPFPRSLAAAIPRALEAIVLKCMQKRKSDRYQSMRELCADLDRFLAGRSVDSESGPWFRRLVHRLVGAPERAPASASTDQDLAQGIEIVRELAAWDANLYRVSGSLTAAFTQLDELIGRLERILAERPDIAWARFYRGVALFRRGRLQEALEEMERSIDRVNDLAGAYYELGRLYLSLYLQQQHRARQHLSHPGVAHELHAARQRLDQAVVALEEARRLRGDLPAWQMACCRAVSRLAAEDIRGCIAICDDILATDADREEVWKLRGDALRLVGEDPQESYDRALQIRRSYFDVLYAKAEDQVGRGAYDEARASLAAARRIHPQYADALALAARVCMLEARSGRDRRELDLGLELAERAMRLEPRHYDACVTRAELALEKASGAAAARWIEAGLEALARARELDGCQNRVNLLTARALLRRARHDPARAAADLDAVRELWCDGDDIGPWREVRAEAERLRGGTPPP